MLLEAINESHVHAFPLAPHFQVGKEGSGVGTKILRFDLKKKKGSLKWYSPFPPTHIIEQHCLREKKKIAFPPPPLSFFLKPTAMFYTLSFLYTFTPIPPQIITARQALQVAA